MPNLDKAHVITVVKDCIQQLHSIRPRDDAPLLSSGLIDSLAILRVLSHIEQRLGYRIPSGAIQAADFETAESLANAIVHCDDSDYPE